MGWVRLSVAFVIVGASAMTLTLPQGAEAAGPWRAQVVDAETGTPLDGVVVLAVWMRREASVGGWAGGGYHASEEVVTGPDGRFVIQARTALPPVPLLTTIKGPEFFIFKLGFGRWRFRNEPAWLNLPYEQREAQYDAAWKQFTGEGVTVELPPLKTRTERMKALPVRPLEVPDSRMPRLLEAINQERLILGLEPLQRKIGGPQ